MKAVCNVPKRSGSCVTTRNGAMLTAMRASTVRGLVKPQWQLEGGTSEYDAMLSARELRERLSMACDELNGRPHSSFADLEALGVFGGFSVLDRRGFWRVEVEV